MRISESERQILSAIQFRADCPVPALAKITGLKEHTIQYYLTRFKEQGLIRRWAFLNMFALGLEEYEVYFSLCASGKNLKNSFLKTLREHERVVWLAELGGDFQYAMTLYAANVHEASGFIEGLAQKFGNIFCRKSIALVISFTIFAKKYLSNREPHPSVEMLTLSGGNSPGYELDKTDRAIIPCLFDPAISSHHDISRATGIARATLEYRLKKMEQAGVIQKYIYHISAARLGMNTFKLLVYSRGVQPALKEALFAFCRKHANISNFTHCMGSWDYEIGVEVPSPQEATVLVELLYDKFGQSINEIQILPIFAQTNSMNFMRAEKTGANAKK